PLFRSVAIHTGNPCIYVQLQAEIVIEQDVGACVSNGAASLVRKQASKVSDRSLKNRTLQWCWLNHACRNQLVGTSLSCACHFTRLRAGRASEEVTHSNYS